MTLRQAHAVLATPGHPMRSEALEVVRAHRRAEAAREAAKLRRLVGRR